MKRTKQSLCLLAVIIPLLVGSSARAEVLQTSLPLQPPTAVPANSWIGCQVRILVFVDRDPNGRVIGGKLSFELTGGFYIPGARYIGIEDLSIRQGSRSGTGPAVFTADVNYNNSDVNVDFVTDIPARSVDVETLKRLLKSPSSFFVNMTAYVDGVGLMNLRGQMAYFTEYHATTVKLNPTQGANASATATGTVTVHPTRNVETGSVAGGFVNITISYDFPEAVAITGVDLQNGSSGENGPRLLQCGVTEASPIIAQTGKGTVSLSAPVVTASDIALVNALFANPAEVSVNFRTAVGGTLRAQLQGLSVPPLILFNIDSRARPVNSPGRVGLSVRNVDVGSSFVIDGQLVPITRRQANYIECQLPALSATHPRAVAVQVQNAEGVRSESTNIVVYSMLQSTQAVFVDAARFSPVLVRGGISAAFGSQFSTNTAVASTTALPISLDGTSVYVNGLLAPLFYVSPTQVNFQVPYENYFFRDVEIVVLAKDGTASLGYATIADTAPGIFTRLGDGKGAPSAYASSDGVKFNLDVSNPDGSPAPIDAGAYVSLYGTGIRYASGPVLVSIGGTTVIALFAGPHGTYAGLDQVNFQIPASIATRGEVDLVISVDDQPSNPVRLKIR